MPTGARKNCAGHRREKYGDQDTDGSHSVRSFFDTLREAGGTARLMLVQAARRASGNKPITECHTELHEVIAAPFRQNKLGYGELAASARKLRSPQKEKM